MPERETFAERLGRLMRERGLKQMKLAYEADVGHEAVKRLLDGRSKEPSAPTLLRLARTLGVSPYYLLGEPEPYASRVTEALPAGSAAPPHTASADVDAAVAKAEARFQRQIDRLERLVLQTAQAGKLAARAQKQARQSPSRKGARPS